MCKTPKNSTGGISSVDRQCSSVGGKEEMLPQRCEFLNSQTCVVRRRAVDHVICVCTQSCDLPPRPAILVLFTNPPQERDERGERQE